MKMYASEKGQGLVEYALIFALVVLVILLVFVFFGPGVGHMYSNVVDSI